MLNAKTVDRLRFGVIWCDKKDVKKSPSHFFNPQRDIAKNGGRINTEN